MINAKYELLSKLENYEYSKNDIKCFKIILTPWGIQDTNLQDKPEQFTHNSEGDLFYYLDFEYDNGYGIQLIKGVVLMNDGCWFERSEYDGSEWWELKKPLTCKDVENYKA